MNLPAVANRYEPSHQTSKASMMPSTNRVVFFDESSTPAMNQGTPRDVRMFPLSESPRRSSSSSSIPIAPPSSKTTADDAQFAYDTAAAQYRDYIMYQRIVTAKQRQLQARLNVEATRVPAFNPQATDSFHSLLSHREIRYPNVPCPDTAHNVAFAHNDDYAEEGVFELEL